MLPETVGGDARSEEAKSRKTRKLDKTHEEWII